MRLSPHQVLASLADNERNKAEDALMAMAKKRQGLRGRKEAVELHIQQLGNQRKDTMKEKTQAATLMMMDSAMLEQRDHLEQIQAELEQLHIEEQELLQHWVSAHQKNKTHQKMIDADEKKKQRLKDRRVQQQLDDVYASRRGREI
ncbi:MAG: hypothetical protein R8K22_04545 [Mariprofundaceae bacterium]